VTGPDPQWGGESPERLYVLTGGRSGSADRPDLDLVTLILTQSAAQPSTPPEHAAILRMCQYPLSVAEISAYLRLPVSVVMVLVTDLLSARQVIARPPVRAADRHDPELLKAVMYGLQRL
jgi:Protein of unknown function (DUF742)